ncbi:MAG: iron donor protein CyaY [Sulfurimicrobium sp.]
MTPTEFTQLVDATLSRIEQAIEASDADIDFETSAGILELEFQNGSKISINRQSASQELWVAAKSGGYHYVWKDDAWRNTRDGSELFAALSRDVSAQAGQTVEMKI